MGIEGVAGAVGNAAKSAVKTTTAQVDATSNDIANQLYGQPPDAASLQAGLTGSQEQMDPNGDKGIEAAGQGKATAALKAQSNVRNPAAQSAAYRRQNLLKSKSPDDVDKLERLRKLLHDEQVRDIMEPRKQQPEESVADKQAREEEEKKKKKQEKQYVEEKKKEDLAVTQKKTSIENKAWGAG